MVLALSLSRFLEVTSSFQRFFSQDRNLALFFTTLLFVLFISFIMHPSLFLLSKITSSIMLKIRRIVFKIHYTTHDKSSLSPYFTPSPRTYKVVEFFTKITLSCVELILFMACSLHTYTIYEGEKKKRRNKPKQRQRDRVCYIRRRTSNTEGNLKHKQDVVRRRNYKRARSAASHAENLYQKKSPLRSPYQAG